MPVLVKPCRAVNQNGRQNDPFCLKRAVFLAVLIVCRKIPATSKMRLGGILVIPKAFLTYLKSFLGVFKEYIIK